MAEYDLKFGPIGKLVQQFLQKQTQKIAKHFQAFIMMIHY